MFSDVFVNNRILRASDLPPAFLARLNCPLHVDPPPTATSQKVTVALELEGVLVSTTFFQPSEPSHLIEFTTEEGPFAFYVSIRSGIQAFLTAAAELVDLVVFTTAAPAYATAVLDLIDPAQTLFKRRFFRNVCSLKNSRYLKDLKVLGIPQHRVIAIESADFPACLQPEQVIPLYRDADYLQDLFMFLKTVSASADVGYTLRKFRHQQNIKQCR